MNHVDRVVSVHKTRWKARKRRDDLNIAIAHIARVAEIRAAALRQDGVSVVVDRMAAQMQEEIGLPAWPVRTVVRKAGFLQHAVVAVEVP